MPQKLYTCIELRCLITVRSIEKYTISLEKIECAMNSKPINTRHIVRCVILFSLNLYMMCVCWHYSNGQKEELDNMITL